MKGIILAAGYAKRLRPLTENFPKPLLDVDGKPIIDHVLESMESIGINDVYVITNARFEERFRAWAKGKNVTLLSDGSTSEGDKLGAIGDIDYAINKIGIDDDVLVIGGDSILTFSIGGAYRRFIESNENLILAYDLKSAEAAKSFGVIEMDNSGRVLSFEEKPKAPKSTLCSTCAYFYPRKTLPLIRRYLDEGNNPDTPGSFVQYLLAKKIPVLCMSFDKPWFDIGTVAKLAEAREHFSKARRFLNDIARKGAAERQAAGQAGGKRQGRPHF
jgi:glucose-1-phosphate thymidylyltransferase